MLALKLWVPRAKVLRLALSACLHAAGRQPGRCRVDASPAQRSSRLRRPSSGPRCFLRPCTVFSPTAFWDAPRPARALLQVWCWSRCRWEPGPSWPSPPPSPPRHSPLRRRASWQPRGPPPPPRTLVCRGPGAYPLTACSVRPACSPRGSELARPALAEWRPALPPVPTQPHPPIHPPTFPPRAGLHCLHQRRDLADRGVLLLCSGGHAVVAPADRAGRQGRARRVLASQPGSVVCAPGGMPHPTARFEPMCLRLCRECCCCREPPLSTFVLPAWPPLPAGL